MNEMRENSCTAVVRRMFLENFNNFQDRFKKAIGNFIGVHESLNKRSLLMVAVVIFIQLNYSYKCYFVNIVHLHENDHCS